MSDEQSPMGVIRQARAALETADSFMSGFEDDETQEGIDGQLYEIRTAIQACDTFCGPAGDLGDDAKHTQQVASQPAGPMQRALRECLGAMQSMADQIDQMKGMFDDNDGTIAAALEDGERAQIAAHAALDGAGDDGADTPAAATGDATGLAPLQLSDQRAELSSALHGLYHAAVKVPLPLQTHPAYGAFVREAEAARQCLDKLEKIDAIAKHATADGRLYVQVWQRDCDMVEFDSVHEIEATVQAYDELRENIEQGAEGPVRLTLMTAEEAAAFECSERDLILEARENGEHYNVTPRGMGMR